ncbi:hypothetical protein COV16_04310 [Candidatus Woesearchaeota archaeon CG10_big_fil_rev_8_21_14_0_10_34_8]|nr:MAG: hypothetical protein COV16_04310 [Candidatus Woesearchaeota archaeon CG10_big_fil_rev_8_21_14_0_10_34_8]
MDAIKRFNNKQNNKSKMKLTKLEKNIYVMSHKRDYEILLLIKQIEKQKLTKQDKSLIRLIKTQLKKDWRTPLIKELNKLLRRY